MKITATITIMLLLSACTTDLSDAAASAKSPNKRVVKTCTKMKSPYSDWFSLETTSDATPPWMASDRIFFATNSAIINDAAKKILDRQISWIEHYKYAGPLLIEGHADSRGSVRYNNALAKRRAMAVYRLYVTYGYPKEKLKVVSYGKSRPVELLENEQGWSHNRRATVHPDPKYFPIPGGGCWETEVKE